MDNGRADPFADTDDLSDFQPQAPAARPKIDAAAIREVSEKHRFPSRAAAEKSSSPQVKYRRRRTGRSHQLNLKVQPEFAQRLGEIADREKVGLGEAFEKAVEALERELAAKRAGG